MILHMPHHFHPQTVEGRNIGRETNYSFYSYVIYLIVAKVMIIFISTNIF